MPFRFHTSWIRRYLHALTLQQIFALVFVMSISLFTCWYYFVQYPLAHHLNMLHKEFYSLQEQQTNLQQEQDNLFLLEKNYQDLYQIFSKLFTHVQPIRIVLDQLVNLLANNDLSCRTINPIAHYEACSQEFIQYSIQITARGSYQAMHQWLHKLSQSKEFIPSWMLIQRNKQKRLELQFVCKVLAQTEESI